MDIVCCTDTHYIMPTGIMLKSLIDNNRSEKLSIHVIIDDSVTEPDKRALTEITEGYISFYSLKFAANPFARTNLIVTRA